jgi:flagellar basal-body rod protein FlgB
MNGGILDTKLMGMLEKALDLSTRRHQLISANIANVDTPGYRTKDIDFAAALKQASESPESQTLGSLLGLAGGLDQMKQDPEVIETQGLAIRNDGNNVNADREMANLAENSLQYTLATQLLGREFSLIRSAIREGR